MPVEHGAGDLAVELRLALRRHLLDFLATMMGVGFGTVAGR
ncbi:MAG: hypothetical protein U1E87_01610 [Alphaproteobacteria bacterium]